MVKLNTVSTGYICEHSWSAYVELVSPLEPFLAGTVESIVKEGVRKLKRS
jgi:hypothetical protein